MCNLYKVPTPEPVAEYFRGLMRQYRLDVAKPVGPLGTGLFLRPGDGGGLEPMVGQWGMIPKDSPTRTPMSKPRGAEKPRRLSTNNARLEGVGKSWTFGLAWRAGRRCLIPAEWYAEPNWESGKNIWWHLRRRDGAPWALAGLWSEWVDQASGEVVPNFTMLTTNCDSHPLLRRLHKPDPKLGPDQQDKRSLIHVEPERWEQWLHGTEDEAREVLGTLPVPDFYDPSDRDLTDRVLAELAAGEPPVLL